MDLKKSVSRGMSLVEMSATIGIISITLALSTPTMLKLHARNAMSSSINLFLTQLHLARSNAVTLEKHITLCPASTPESCGDDHQAWHKGYLIFQDNNRNRELDIPGETLVSYEERAQNDIQIVSSSRHRNRISYRPMGRAWFSNTTMRFCHPDYPELNRAIIISNNGRTRTTRRMPDGTSITCE